MLSGSWAASSPKNGTRVPPSSDLPRTHAPHAVPVAHARELRRRSKFRVSTKNKKLIVTLKKREKMGWGQLRANVALPYRRGGGGAPR